MRKGLSIITEDLVPDALEQHDKLLEMGVLPVTLDKESAALLGAIMAAEEGGYNLQMTFSLSKKALEALARDARAHEETIAGWFTRKFRSALLDVVEEGR